MRSTKELRSQLESAHALMEGETTTLEKIEKIKVLLGGINPVLDAKLDAVFKTYNHVKASLHGDVIHLSVHGLSEMSPVEKKRKKALILFIASWKSLMSEVSRVQGYYNNSQSGSITAGSIVKTGLFAKGPFGLITLVAVAIVGIGLFLRSSTTIVEIKNLGCPPLVVPTELPIKIPGIHLPKDPIVTGTPDFITLPKLTVSISSSVSSISATVFGQTASYSLPSRVTAVIFDEQSLLNQSATLKLGSRSTHHLIIECK